MTISVTARGDLYGNGADIERNFGRKTGHMVVRVGEQVVQPSSAPVYGERDFYGPPLTGINYYDGGPVQQALGKRGFTYQFVFDLPREAWSTEVEFVFISRTSSKRWPISIDLNGVR